MVAAVGLFVAIASSGSAHEHTTSGDLEFVVGWGTEPAVVNQFNTIDIEVIRHLQPSGTERVENVADNLTATISTGSVSAVKAVEPKEDSPGWYSFPIVPTRLGTYTVQVSGEINGTMFDVSVDVEDVVAGDDVDFPVSDPTPQDLNDNATAQQAQIAALQAQVATLESTGGSVTKAQLDEATSQSSTATLLAVVGALAGIAGVAVGAMGVRKGRGAPPQGGG